MLSSDAAFQNARQVLAPGMRLCQLPTGLVKAQSVEYAQIMATVATRTSKDAEAPQFL